MDSKIIDIVIENLINKVKHSKEVVNAGIWQATELFKDEEMYVLRNAVADIYVPNNKETLAELTKADLPWAEDHFQERISGIPSNPGITYKYWPYHNNLDESEFKTTIFSHTYQERFWPKRANRPNDCGENIGLRYSLGDLNDLIQQLKDNPLTRQAYLPIWFPEDTLAAKHKQRVPCTLGYYFWISEGKLFCNYIIRSCDVLRHFRNDVYLTCRLLQYIAKSINTKVGEVSLFIFNLHLFKNDMYALRKKENYLKYGRKN